MTMRFSTGLVEGMYNTSPFKTLMDNGVIRFYTGGQPASADDAPTGTYLGLVTQNAGAFTPGVATNGLAFDDMGTTTDRVISKAAAETWQFKGTAAGTIGWGRFVGNATDNDSSSTTLVRIDFTIGITSGDMRLTSVTSAVDKTITIDTFDITVPV